MKSVGGKGVTMSDRLPDDKLDRLYEMERVATPGPWKAADCVVRGWDQAIGLHLGEFNAYQNAALTVAARNALRPLLDEVREARKRIAEMEGEIARHRELYEEAYAATGIGAVRPSKQQIARALAGYQHDLEKAEKRISRIRHCDHCGGDWYEGLQSECYCKRIAELEETVQVQCDRINELDGSSPEATTPEEDLCKEILRLQDRIAELEAESNREQTCSLSRAEENSTCQGCSLCVEEMVEQRDQALQRIAELEVEEPK